MILNQSILTILILNNEHYHLYKYLLKWIGNYENQVKLNFQEKRILLLSLK